MDSVAATASFWIGATAVAGTASGHGPFVLPELSQSLFLLQTFIALVAATVLLLGAIVAERAIALEQTRQARDEAAHASLAKAEFVAVMSAEIFDAVEPLVRPELHRKHFVLKRELARPMLAVQADPDGLRQILVNLLSNAWKYTEEGGSITLGADRQRNEVCIWVSETGAGIPTELA